jgi:hypothetical protein
MPRIQIVALLVVLTACGRSGEPGGGNEPRGDAPRDVTAIVAGGRGSATVTYQPDVKLVEHADGLRALRGVSSDGFTLLLDASQPEFRSLQAGDVLVIKGLVARKVLATKLVGSEIAALTRAATIVEVVQDGRIALDVPVRFSAAHARSASARPPARHPITAWNRLADLAVPPAYAQSPEGEVLRKAERGASRDAMGDLALGAIKGIYEGWETTFSAVPGNGRVDISLKLTKDVGGFRAVITGDGYLADFDLSSGIEVQRGALERLQVAHRKLNGVINFHWEVAKDTPGAQTGDDRIKLPAAISIPLYQYLGGLPLFLEISGALIIQPAISGGKEYSKGSFRVTYDGTQSFQVKEGNVDADGKVTGKVEFLESQNISALAPLGMVVAVAAPRVELSFGTTKLFNMDQMEFAANAVDLIAGQLVESLFGEETRDRLKDFELSKAVKNAVASDAAGYVEVVSTAGMSHTGMSVITPCTRTELTMAVRVGASAQVFGQSMGETKRDIHKHELVRVDPPGTKLCTEIGK